MDAFAAAEAVRSPRWASAASGPALRALVRRLGACSTLDEVLAAVTQATRAMLAADGVTFVLREGDRCYYAAEDAISPLWKGRTFSCRDGCISGWCMKHDQAAAIPDIYQDPRIPHDVYRPTFVRSLAMAPARLDEPIAAVGAYWSERHEFGPGELDLLQAIADCSALALAAIGPTPAPAAAPASLPRFEAELPPPAVRSIAERLDGLRRPGVMLNSPLAYGFAVLCVAAATLVRGSVGLLGVRDLTSFGTYYPAVLIAVLVGGARAGALAAALGAVAAWGFLGPRGSDVSHVLNTLLFALSSAIIIAAVERFRGRLRRLAGEDARHLTLARALEHRAKNTFALVQSIVTESLPDQPDRARAISQRVRAAVAAEVASTSDEGPEPLRDTLEFELEPFGLKHFALDGPDVMLGSQAVTGLALALHELTTNAIKHGALSTPLGRVRIAWTADDESAVICWSETGGPPISGTPSPGFGVTFLRRVLNAVGGSIALSFAPAGLEASLALPLHRPRR
jgi:two-component sensor histidine kinase